MHWSWTPEWAWLGSVKAYSFVGAFVLLSHGFCFHAVSSHELFSPCSFCPLGCARSQELAFSEPVWHGRLFHPGHRGWGAVLKGSCALDFMSVPPVFAAVPERVSQAP